MLSLRQRIAVVDSSPPGASSSSIKWGLANPVMSKQANLVWRGVEAVANLKKLAAKVGISNTVLFRPAQTSKQQASFADAARRNPQVADWLSREEFSEFAPGVVAEYGGLKINTGFAIDIPTFCHQLAGLARDNGADVFDSYKLTSIEKNRDGVVAIVSVSKSQELIELTASTLILCIGSSVTDWHQTKELNLHLIKGEALEVSVPPSFRRSPNLSGSGYVVFHGESATLGSTYDHEFEHPRPTDNAESVIRSKVSRMIPEAADWPVLRRTAGVRVTVPGSYKPMVGPIGNDNRTWVFTGLGSKGLLMSALISSELHRFLRDPEEIPNEIRVH